MSKIVRVWLQGTCFSGSVRSMLVKRSVDYPDITYKPAQSIEASDMVLYLGGADINPAFYSQTALRGTHFDSRQDRSDLDCFRTARRLDKYQVGICRGAQLLNVAQGGTLWQDVDNHAGNSHLVTDVRSKKTFVASSLHHQACILAAEGQLLAYADESNRKVSAKDGWSRRSGIADVEVEAFWYPNGRCLGVQWHPECGPQECVDYFFNYVKDYMELGSKQEIETEIERAVG